MATRNTKRQTSAATRDHPGVRVDDSIAATRPTTLDPPVAEVVGGLGGQRRQIMPMGSGRKWEDSLGPDLGVELSDQIGDSYFNTRV